MCCFIFFFFNDTATTEIYTLSLHDALPISLRVRPLSQVSDRALGHGGVGQRPGHQLDKLVALVAVPHLDRKSTRLNSSHANISYAVFCLKKKTTSLCVRRRTSGVADARHAH